MKIKLFENFEENWEEEDNNSYEGLEFDTYVHGSKDEGSYLAKKLGIPEDHPLFEELVYINYEVKIGYKVINGKPEIISIDNKKVQ